MYDRATDWTDVYPKGSKSGQDTYEAMNHYKGKNETVKQVYGDNAKEIRKAAKWMRWR